MNDLNPLIVGRWDGNHVWIQWTPTPEKSYALRMRYKRPGNPEWTHWIETMGPFPITEYYVRVPTHAAGTWAQAEVGVFKAAGEEIAWERAQARYFGFSEAEFEFTSAKKVTFQERDFFCCMVDSDVAAYHLLAPLDVPGGDVPVIARMRSLQKTGNNQLDYADHFSFSPRPGVQVRNISPSDSDLEMGDLVMTLGDGVTIEHAPSEGESVLLLGKVNQPRL